MLDNISQNGAFAVIDGHGGQHAAEFIKDNLEAELLSQRNLDK
jgi:serine/threonine protein phosphatase PrpC